MRSNHQLKRVVDTSCLVTGRRHAGDGLLKELGKLQGAPDYRPYPYWLRYGKPSRQFRGMEGCTGPPIGMPAREAFRTLEYTAGIR